MFNRKAIGIELQEDYVKIGLRRLQLASEYNGTPIIKEQKSYQKQTSESELQTSFNFL